MFDIYLRFEGKRRGEFWAALWLRDNSMLFLPQLALSLRCRKNVNKNELVLWFYFVNPNEKDWISFKRKFHKLVSKNSLRNGCCQWQNGWVMFYNFSSFYIENQYKKLRLWKSLFYMEWVFNLLKLQFCEMMMNLFCLHFDITFSNSQLLFFN